MTTKERNTEKIAEIELNGERFWVTETIAEGDGAFACLDRNGKTLMTIAKPLGKVGERKRPRVKRDIPVRRRKPSASEERIMNSKVDLLGKAVLAKKGDPSYEKVADLLPPLEFPYTFLGDKEYPCRPSPRVDWDGSIRDCLGFGLNGEPLDWTRDDQQNIQYGLMGGYLPAIQFVYVNEERRIGWEEIAVAKAYPEHDDALLVFIRFKLSNLDSQSREEVISLFFAGFKQTTDDDPNGQIIDAKDFYPTFNGAVVERPEYLWVSEPDDLTRGTVYPFGNINIPCDLKPGEEKSLYLIVAYPRPLKEGAFAGLIPGANFYNVLFETQKKWDAFLSQGMRVETPETRVNDACKASLIQGFMTVAGSDIHYAAAGIYGNAFFRPRLNGLPISLIHPLECFLEWGYAEESQRYLDYFLENYIKDDGSFSYQDGAGGYDSGLFLYAVSRCYRLGGADAAWVARHSATIKRVSDYIVAKRNESLLANPEGSPLRGLISMVCCDDLNFLERFYNYANDACCWLGLRETGKMLLEAGEKTGTQAMAADGETMIARAEDYKKDIVASMTQLINRASKPVFVPIYPDASKPFPSMTAISPRDHRYPPRDGLASYANFNFYPFMLYANLFDADIAAAALDFRTKRGGEILGTSRIGGGPPHTRECRLDDWPIAAHAWTLLNLDRVEQFLLTYYADLAHHRMRDIFTAYEQVGIADIGGGRLTIGCNICSTLAFPRMTKHMLVFEERDADEVWLNRAAPDAWLEDGKKIIVEDAPTRWGKIGYRVESRVADHRVSARINIPAPLSAPVSIKLRLRHPTHKKIREVSVNGVPCQNIDADKGVIAIPRVREGRFDVEARYHS